MIKKYIALLLCFLLCSGALFAQAPGVGGDSQLFKLVEKAYKDSDFDGCVTHAEEYLNKFPFASKKMEVTLYKGLSLIKLKKIDEAMVVFEDMDQSFPDYEKNDKIKYTLGKLYYKTGNNENAKDILSNLIELYPASQYTPKAKTLLELMGEDVPEKKKETKKSKTKKEPEKTSYTETSKSESFYSFGKMTWAKVAAGACLLSAPIFYLMGSSKQSDADNIYDTQYLNAGNAVDAEKFYNDADNAAEKAASYKTMSAIAFLGGVGFFAVDYFSVGRVAMGGSVSHHSWNLNLKTRF